MCGGGGGNTTQTVTNEPPPQLVPFLRNAGNEAERAFNTPINFFPGQTVASTPTSTQAGVENLATSGNRLAGVTAQNAGISGANQLATTASSNTQPALQAALTPGIQNPFIDQVVQRALESNTSNFLNQAMPAINSQAVADNAYGGSRQGVAQGLALQGLADANAGAATNILAQEFGNQAQRNLAGVQLVNQAGGAAVGAGGQLLNLDNAITENQLRSGDITRQLEQEQIDDQVARFNFDQQIGRQQLDSYINRLSALAFGGQTTSSGGFQAAQPSTFSQVVGGAALGNALLGGLGSIGEQ